MNGLDGTMGGVGEARGFAQLTVDAGVFDRIAAKVDEVLAKEKT